MTCNRKLYGVVVVGSVLADLDIGEIMTDVVGYR
jgi:hypothetical protein